MSERKESGIAGPLAGLYDVFVDWPGRLGREMPGIVGRLREVGAARVLDAGCGTGRHVGALRAEGFDAHGADVSDEMLTKAREHLDGSDGLHVWRMGEMPTESIRAAAPFDAITCLGNVWPSLGTDREIAAALAGFQMLLKPGGLILVGLKAVAIRRETNAPYLPLLKREHEGEALFFVRFVDFDVATEDGAHDMCDFHMTVIRGDAASEEREALIHRASRWRVWSPESLATCFRDAGFDARVSATLAAPDVTPETEDVFVHATARTGA